MFPITWTHIIIVLELAIIEGLLSFDNALALAALVKKKLKNPEQQKKALLWGIWGAYIMRTATILLGVFLMKYEWVKASAGIYLVYLAVHELFFVKKLHKKDVEEKKNIPAGSIAKASTRVFILAILQVELMDFMFSIDGVAVALAISNVPWVLVSGAVLGILMMRVAARYFIVLIDKFPILEKTAFVLVGVSLTFPQLHGKVRSSLYNQIHLESKPDPRFLSARFVFLLVECIHHSHQRKHAQGDPRPHASIPVVQRCDHRHWATLLPQHRRQGGEIP